jgi:hypothetical protein
LSEEDFKFCKVTLPSMLFSFFVPVVVIPRGFERKLSASFLGETLGFELVVVTTRGLEGLSPSLAGMILGLVIVVRTAGIFETVDELCNHSTTFLMGFAEGELAMAVAAGSCVARGFSVSRLMEVEMMAKPLSEIS